ncbi:YcxB family protein [Aliivibrio sp. S4TY2]|uniref:YcxB family protein n=1 Tax=unclassified Aliivibrio TaxID=2645654 RepID=UPI002377FBE9|nr:MULTISPECIES: YcxB family protein [unclassified Aliivibrio]MDD9156527.1 YcxB family protein [Aliivibrio sp. S4TY2]MDD9160036.1 YcxB family protein [Aliivibrio sp. S4TY1]MDD9164258.1 YcxB family protein [Aliivibrio sp. S4MY2]MDD9168234.1 YcxB family protein [Aliivibrio sp. S4MY4]MDD9184570.1 YcxB family protein [Aliivibrio sp. S4MY3]
MSKDFSVTTEYILDKTFFAECYDQTSQPITFPKAYLKGILFFLFGVALLKLELLPNGYIGWFFIALSIIEAFSIYFKKTWWVWRQSISSLSGSKVVFQVDANGVSYKSLKNTKNSRTIAWSDIDQVEQSDLGLIFHIGKQRQYVSKSCLNEEEIAFILEQHEQSKAE